MSCRVAWPGPYSQKSHIQAICFSNIVDIVDIVYVVNFVFVTFRWLVTMLLLCVLLQCWPEKYRVLTQQQDLIQVSFCFSLGV